MVSTAWGNDLTSLGQSIGWPHYLPVLCCSSSFQMIAPVFVSIMLVRYHLLLMTCQVPFYSFRSFKQIIYFMQIDHMIQYESVLSMKNLIFTDQKLSLRPDCLF